MLNSNEKQKRKREEKHNPVTLTTSLAVPKGGLGREPCTHEAQ